MALDERRVKFFPSFCTSGGKRKDQQTNPADLKSNAIVEPETDVEEVFFAGAHCGTLWFSLQSAFYLSVPFQMSGVDLWRTVHATVSLAFPFGG